MMDESSFRLDRTVRPVHTIPAKYCGLWKRWTCEYAAVCGPKAQMIGDVVILREDKSNRGK